MLKAIWGGVIYAVAVFSLAFLTGALRTVAVSSTGAAPVLGVAIELPVLLLASWVICGLLLERVHVPADLGARMLMGAVALIVMLSAEFALSAIVFGRSLLQSSPAMNAPRQCSACWASWRSRRFRR